MRPSEFLRQLWGDQPPGLIQLWQLDGRQSFYLRNPQAADYYADRRTDIYTAVGLAPRRLDRHRRARAGEIVAIAGLWLDIDVNGGPDRKTGAAPDVTAALDLARAVAQPTLLVSSGHGIHAWWLFQQPWRFASRAEQHAAATAAAQWGALHRAQAAARGWSLDRAHDLARLLRLPGTRNGKGGVLAPVELVAGGGPRYDRAALLELAAQAGPITVELTPAATAASITQPDAGDADDATRATPIADRIRALIANDQTFADTWRNQRVDAPDWSMSEYDLSVATQLALADWPPADIATAITLHRRRHDPADPKAHRPDYLHRTVARAREHAAARSAREQLRLLAETGRAAA